MSLDLSQIITQIIAFLAMLWILKRYAWKHILALLDERQDKIQSEFDSIASQQAEAKQLLETYEKKLRDIEAESRHIIRDAASQGRKVAAQIQEDALLQSRKIVEEAKLEVNQEIEKAYILLRKDMIQMVIQISEKFLRQKLDDDSHKKLIEDFVEETKVK